MAEAEEMTARERLRRAQKLLSEGKSESLALAARELIQGFDERQRDYDEARRELKRKKRQGWSVAQLGIKVEKAYKSADAIIEISVFDRVPERTVISLYHTPVGKQMKARAKRLAEGLASLDHAVPADPMAAEWRELLRQSSADLDAATRGTLLAPPMLNKKATKMHFAVEDVEGDRADAIREALELIGVRYKLHARCLDRLP
ncbi:MAG: hypothetical protein WCC36_01215 [Gammaproteobacteria bacterium]